MKYLFQLSAILLFTILISCNKETGKTIAKDHTTTSDTTTPSCILNMIATLQNEPIRNPPAVVYEYTYANQKVYYVSADCCDQWNQLYDSNCNLICAPDGGIANQGDGRCSDFFSTRSNERLVWRDPR